VDFAAMLPGRVKTNSSVLEQAKEPVLITGANFGASSISLHWPEDKVVEANLLSGNFIYNA